MGIVFFIISSPKNQEMINKINKENLKLKNLPFWFPKKDNFVWYLLFISIFLLSLDFWSWGASEPLFFGLPFWMWYLLFLTLFLSGLFYLFSMFFWREEN
jgi:hypothetical protein